MKNLNFTCPHCGGHKLICEQQKRIQYDVLGLDEKGHLILDYDTPSIVDYDGYDYKTYCENCDTKITGQELIKQNKK